jgi:hypothetical protein
MEEALKKATEEAHRQRIELAGGADSETLVQGGELSGTNSKALADLKKT